ncbi:hypothetical protein LAZ67_8000547 [Cordylochernes scorpioides]|uniref:Uncharacterized protein n=1 Tax=Cordylochernes scorpioides TaxID=51811 RepID=A0ABY6KUK1_9ARAC|nr:hypothetical protein LAZ67_8000547 [Cordylochernes scorpioides]
MEMLGKKQWRCLDQVSENVWTRSVEMLGPGQWRFWDQVSGDIRTRSVEMMGPGQWGCWDQETKLNEKYNLKYKNYNILRKDRNKEGGGLAFLIKNLYYEDIAINIPNTSDLEAQGIKVYLNQNKTINIFNMYHPPNNKLIDDGTMAQFLTDNTIINKRSGTKLDIFQKHHYLSSQSFNTKSTHNIFHEKINMKELDYALENTDLNKTPGPDGIHGQMISNLGKNGKEKLLDIFNNSWKTGKLPQDWKTATIIPIKKLDKSADDPKNYRPISLTSICCKLMEKNYTQTTHLPPRHKKSLTKRTIWI